MHRRAGGPAAMAWLSRAVIVGTGGSNEVQQYMQAGCRRKVLDAYLDGTDRERCGSGEEACDCCRDNHHPKRPLDDVDDQQTRKRQRLAHQRTKQAISWAQEAQGARAAMDFWSSRCLLCHGRGLLDNHFASYCEDADAKDLAQIKKWRRALKMADFSACFHCLLPQCKCTAWTERRTAALVPRTGAPCKNSGGKYPDGGVRWWPLEQHLLPRQVRTRTGKLGKQAVRPGGRGSMAGVAGGAQGPRQRAGQQHILGVLLDGGDA